MSKKVENKENVGNDTIHSVSKRFTKGAVWQNIYDKSIIKIIDDDWIGRKVRMTDGTVFSKKFLSKYYKHIT